jgi:hypothetical protein
MVGTYKSFDQKEYDLTDKPGRNAFRKFCNHHYPLKTINNPNIHGIDLLTIKDGKVVICWEIEVRRKNWVGDVPFPERFARNGGINCIERKEYQWRRDKKFLSQIPIELAPDYKIYYVQLNDVCTRAVVIDADTVMKYPRKPWDNRLQIGEYVRQVPLDKTIQVRISL